jgi:hypothetical protein
VVLANFTGPSLTAVRWFPEPSGYQTKSTNPPGHLKQIRAPLEETPALTEIDDSFDSLAADLKQTIFDLEATQKQAVNLESEAKKRIAKVAGIPELLAQTKTSIRIV